MWIIAQRNRFLFAGAAILLASLALIGVFGFNPGIDFTGGSLTETSYDVRPEKTVIESALGSLDLGGFSVRETIDDGGRDSYLISTRDLTDSERIAVEGAVRGAGEGGEVTRFTSIGPVIGSELAAKAKWAVGAVALVIVLYVAFAFRGVRKPVGSSVYGGITILALLHDVLIPTALMSVLGHYYGFELDVLFVMAILAVLGYSVNDTIVVFDRVRENLVKYRQEKKIMEKDEHGMKVERIEYLFTKPFAAIVGESVSDTILRSVNTSLTTFLAVTALYVFGGETTQSFALVLGAGIVAGTYSSIFLAAPLLVTIEEWQTKRRGA